ncbi:hypothetical protein S40285_06925 [Stachybotrys chlorohalonatus IBT 40285]|uniref:Anaphase-promoting complex subunit 4 WD40 domain-containing protein n=1 Tax=Stachybotrys chlorohalonatus (strain IBT 40285) TaxID=1283841 RepID=A0A084QH16_STAC4|nr:hypothetical protein S40285_06925 [Stachybotrys chlorohalonata IBT 40285]
MYTLANTDSFSFTSFTKSPVYALAAHRTSAGVAALTSDGALSVLDPSRLHHGPQATVATGHGHASVLRPYDWRGSVVATAGEDGTVAVWDLRAGREGLRLNGPSRPCTHIHMSSPLPSLTENTRDPRSPSGARASYDEPHSDDITSLTFHPSDAAVLMSGSTDGLVNVYDTRVADEDEVILQTFNHNASIHHATFLTGTAVAALSHDEQFALYDMADENPSGDAAQHFGDLRQRLACQYVADISPKIDGTGATVGVGAQDQQAFQLIHLGRGDSAWDFDGSSVVALPGAHGEEIVRSFCFFDEIQLVITAGEDGSVKAWKAEG